MRKIAIATAAVPLALATPATAAVPIGDEVSPPTGWMSEGPGEDGSFGTPNLPFAWPTPPLHHEVPDLFGGAGGGIRPVTFLGWNFTIFHDPDRHFYETLNAAVAVAAVPEPGTWAMLLVGFAAIGGALRRSRRRDRPARV